ncbi:GNAT family N-acetyltransferase [Bacillus carboniphilus]|uniref:GNAT family N-acetyltransferase n=1 Tax=Bacillus carboniphilus TaxID=86663 RepID=A0ABN0W740_9BACI
MKDLVVRIVKVGIAEKSIFESLVSLYLHDLSEYTNDLDINSQGNFEYNGLHLYWEREELIPFFILLEEKVVGFVLLNQSPFIPAGFDYGINELFVLRKFRGKDIAKMAVKELFSMYKGTYYIVQLTKNQPAVNFWRRLYKNLNLKVDYIEKTVDGEPCNLQKVSVQ